MVGRKSTKQQQQQRQQTTRFSVRRGQKNLVVIIEMCVRMVMNLHPVL